MPTVVGVSGIEGYEKISSSDGEVWMTNLRLDPFATNTTS
jgi:hypothetical protein